MHDADLSNRYGTGGQQLDIIELAAILAAMPEKFSNDPLKVKQKMVLKLEESLKELMDLRKQGKLSNQQTRNVAYINQTPRYVDQSGFAIRSIRSFDIRTDSAEF